MSQNNLLGSWNIINIKYNYSKNINIFLESQLRSLSFYDNFHYYEIKGEIGYKIEPHVKFSVGCGTHQTFREGGNFRLPKNNSEFRLWPQVTLYQKWNKLRLDHRYRYEMRWTSSGFRNRFRLRPTLTYSFGPRMNENYLFFISLSNELFFTNTAPYFERNRTQTVLGIKPFRFMSFQTGYVFQFDYKINDEIGRDFLLIGIFYEISNISNTFKSKKSN